MAEEVLRSIRTVVAFGGEQKEFERYSTKLQEAQRIGKRKGMFSGIGEGVGRFFFFAFNALAFWYGVILILDDREKPDEEKEYTPAVLMIVSFHSYLYYHKVIKNVIIIVNFLFEYLFTLIRRGVPIYPLHILYIIFAIGTYNLFILTGTKVIQYSKN